ncbi:MAG TPA: hypothetical protein VK670_14725, partial [Silvibacterium sp.]|nr:hypothetical protein [Silvibacterium sp.]
RPSESLAYSTDLGFCLNGKAEDLLRSSEILETIQNRVDLIFTSPPFPLNTKKKYGNLNGENAGVKIDHITARERRDVAE